MGLITQTINQSKPFVVMTILYILLARFAFTYQKETIGHALALSPSAKHSLRDSVEIYKNNDFSWDNPVQKDSYVGQRPLLSHLCPIFHGDLEGCVTGLVFVLFPRVVLPLRVTRDRPRSSSSSYIIDLNFIPKHAQPQLSLPPLPLCCELLAAAADPAIVSSPRTLLAAMNLSVSQPLMLQSKVFPSSVSISCFDA